MFVSYSEIIISVIVKHVQNTEIIRTPCLPGGGDLLGFSVPGRMEKLLGGGLLVGNQGDTMHYAHFARNSKL